MADSPPDDQAEGWRGRRIEWFADYIYGTISTLVAVAGLTFETHPEAITSAGIIVVGAFAIWLAHTLSRVVVKRSWQEVQLTWSDIRTEFEGSWPIMSAATPAFLIFVAAGIGLWSVGVAFALTDVVGVLALAVVGVGTVGGSNRPLSRRILYVVVLVGVGATIVVLESLVHVL